MANAPSIQGLTQAEVNARLQRGESNNFKARVGRTYWQIIRDNVLNLFNIVMATLLFIVLLFGDYSTVFFAGFSFVTNSLLGMVQEILAKRKLDQLAALAAQDIEVIRDGETRKIKSHEIVLGDILPLTPGDKIVVDGIIVSCDSLEIDESQLTGESDAILKEVDATVSSGSFCIAGSGVMQATRVGKDSAINRLSVTAKAYKNVLTPTQQRISLIVRITIILMVICTPMIFVAGYLTLGEWINLETFRSAVVFIASIVPQGLVLTAILSLTIGAVSLSRFQTLVQRVNAVESMANVTVLCFDKTGTLTQNKLSVANIFPLNGAADADIKKQLQAYTANLSNLNSTAHAISAHVFENAQAQLPANTPAKLHEIPFTSARKWGAIQFQDETLIFGAPERLLTDSAAQAHAIQLSEQGYRVLALAKSTPSGTITADSVLSNPHEDVALIALHDELRPEIQDTLNQFREQNVRLKVISGDNLETVKQIAQDAGMVINHAYRGEELEAMDAAAFDNAARDGDLFARVEPETKKKLIASLKKQGEYTAMVGDGVNDVPALKEAHLAIVMNDGAQISKDIGDIVLLNNAMSTLPRAFFEGRTITQTIYATSKIFLVKNVYSVLFFLFVGFMFMPFPITPIQISIMTFGVINIPATLIAFRFLKPAFMAKFRHDVLDYVVTSGFIGGVTATIIYGLLYLINDRNVDLARSGSYVFLTLWGMLVMWHLVGINILRPRTIGKHFGLFMVGLFLGVATLAVTLIMPDMINFVMLKNGEWIVIFALFLLAALLVEIMLRTRAVAQTLWKLTAP